MIIMHRRGTTTDWAKAAELAAELPSEEAISRNLLPKDGELVIELCDDGTRYAKIGNNCSDFQSLPYIDERAELAAKQFSEETAAKLKQSQAKLECEYKTAINTTKAALQEAINLAIDKLTDDYLTADARVLEEANQATAKELIDIKATILEQHNDTSNSVSGLGVSLTDTKHQLTKHIHANELQFNNIAATLDTLKASHETVSAELDKAITAVDSKVITNDAVSTSRFDKLSKDLATTRLDLETLVSEKANTQENRIQSVKALLENKLDTQSTTFTKSIANLQQALEQAELSLSDLLAKVDQRDASAIADLLVQLTSIKEHMQLLDNADAELMTKIYEVENVLTSTLHKLIQELYNLTDKHSVDYAELQHCIQAEESARMQTDSTIINTLLSHVMDIYAELADLVDDDILILEKAFSVENKLNDKIAMLNTCIADTNSKVEELHPDELSAFKLELSALMAKHSKTISALQKSLGVTSTRFVDITTSELIDGSTVNPIVIRGADYLASVGDIAFYAGNEFVWNGTNWQDLGSISRAGTLETWRTNLNVLDASTTSSFVTEVNQVDGKISVSRARPTAADIEYCGSNVHSELADHESKLATLTQSCVKVNAADNTIYVGESSSDTFVLYCGTASEI